MKPRKPQRGDPMPWLEPDKRITPAPLSLARQFSGEPPAVLFHYTPPAGMEGILSSGTLWATDLRYLNDTSEFRHGIERFVQLLRSVQGDIQNRAVQAGVELALGLLSNPEHYQVCVFSFCERGDSLSQWRGYCRDGGYSIGFGSAQLAKLGEGALARCLYSDEEQLGLVRFVLRAYVSFFDNYVTQFPAHREVAAVNIFEHLREDLSILAPMIKRRDFDDEREWRLIVPPGPNQPKVRHRQGRNGDIPFVEIPWTTAGDAVLAEVLVGPLGDQDALDKQLRGIILRKKYRGCSVAHSQIPLRDA